MWILISIVILFIAYKLFKNNSYDEGDEAIVEICLFIIVLTIPIIIWSLFIILKCIMLPELVFFSMLQSLI